MSNLKKVGLISVGLIGGFLLSLQFSALAQKNVQNSLPIDELRSFAEVFGAIKQAYVEPVEDKKLITHAISGMLSNLDPHSAYLDAEAYKELQDGTQGEFGGLGIEVGMEDGLVKVVSPIEDTPADRAGVKAGDLIFKLDDTLVKGLTLGDAVKKMRGKPGTKIRLSIMRKNENKPIDLSLTREIIKIQSVKSKLVEEGFGYLRVTSFQENTASDVVKHLNLLYKNGPLKGLVLDLRNDPGGLLNAAIGVSAAFLQPNVLVTSTDGRLPDSKHRFSVEPKDYLHGGVDYIKQLPDGARNVPMVVLINGGSASASEIVAGALQDHKRATIMGTTSFGKGSVQTVFPLTNETGIKITTARYFTPSGRSIQAKGIEPDLVVEEPIKAFSGLQIREADLENHLNNPNEEKELKSTKEPKKAPEKVVKKTSTEALTTEMEDIKPRELASKDDFQLTQAFNKLKGQPVLKDKPKEEKTEKAEKAELKSTPLSK